MIEEHYEYMRTIASLGSEIANLLDLVASLEKELDRVYKGNQELRVELREYHSRMWGMLGDALTAALEVAEEDAND